MAKPTVYLDANIFSVLYYRGQAVSVAHTISTLNWWAMEREFFQLFSSRAVVVELQKGTYAAQDAAVAEARKLPFLHFSPAVENCAAFFRQEGVVPVEKPADAIHLAMATVHGIDYLLTWNYAHLANFEVQRKVALICIRNGWREPYLVSPESIPRVTMGQAIRRRP